MIDQFNDFYKFIIIDVCLINNSIKEACITIDCMRADNSRFAFLEGALITYVLA